MANKVLMKGNEAIAEAAIRAGCRHYFGYPITPQTEVAAYMAKRMPKVGGTFLQAESEVAAINMVYGVASTGRRVMTSSSSPGISLNFLYSGERSSLSGCQCSARRSRTRRDSAFSVRLFSGDKRRRTRRLSSDRSCAFFCTGNGRHDDPCVRAGR